MEVTRLFESLIMYHQVCHFPGFLLLFQNFPPALGILFQMSFDHHGDGDNMTLKATRTSLSEEAIAGLSAGIVGTVIGYPLDVIKTRKQTQTSKTGGILSTGLRIARHEGVLSLYKGIAPPLISLSILNTINFASYSYFQSFFQAERGWDWKNALAGGAVGPLASTVSTIENLVKTQMQLDNISKKQFHGSWDCVRQLTRKNGILVLYTGHAINTARESTFLMSYFFVYEGLRQELIHLSTSETNNWAIPVAGGLSGALAWAFSFPLDCVRAGVQGHDTAESRGAFRVFCDLIERKGFMGLYSGVAPSIARAFLVSGSRFSAYEGALYLLRGGRDVQH